MDLNQCQRKQGLIRVIERNGVNTPVVLSLKLTDLILIGFHNHISLLFPIKLWNVIVALVESHATVGLHQRKPMQPDLRDLRQRTGCNKYEQEINQHAALAQRLSLDTIIGVCNPPLQKHVTSYTIVTTTR